MLWLKSSGFAISQAILVCYYQSRYTLTLQVVLSLHQLAGCDVAKAYLLSSALINQVQKVHYYKHKVTPIREGRVALLSTYYRWYKVFVM